MIIDSVIKIELFEHLQPRVLQSRGLQSSKIAHLIQVGWQGPVRDEGVSHAPAVH